MFSCFYAKFLPENNSMKKTISVTLKLLSTEKNEIIPVSYSVADEDGNPNVKLFSCEVNLSAEDVPEWLSPTSFVIRQVYRDGVTVTELSNIACANEDSAKFVDETHNQIRIAEKTRSW